MIDEGRARIRLRSMTKPPNLAELEEQIERLSIQKDEAVKNAEYEEAAKLRDQAEKLRARRRKRCSGSGASKAKEVDGVVDEEVIAEVVSKMTGVPLTRLEKEEGPAAARAGKRAAQARRLAGRGDQGDQPRRSAAPAPA